MIYLGADHRGFELKEKIKGWLLDWGHQFEDCGAFEYNKTDDYPDFAKKVGESVAKDSYSRGILICGSGVGIAIAANKIKNIRAGIATSTDQIRNSVNDEDINILAISADYIPEDIVKEIIKSFLDSKFSGEERHVRRINKIKEIENG